MKNLTLILLGLIVWSLSIQAQTIDHGDGVISVQNGNSYKLTRNLKSNNGGSVSMTFSGTLKDGKRDGIWKLSATYNNYGGGNGYFFTGTSTMTRTYNNGILDGAYSLNQNIKQRTGSYNRYKGGWVYGPFEDGSEIISGSFKNGKPTGKWSINAPMLKCTFELSDGVPVGEATVTKTAMGGGIKIKFRDGYMVYWEPITNKGYAEGLTWNDSEDLENLPNQEEFNLLDDLDFLASYMSGSDLAKWLNNYPKGSSTEDITITYKTADRNNHKADFGNPPEYILAMRKAGRKARALEDSRKLDFEYSENIRKNLNQFHDSLPEWIRDFYNVYNFSDNNRAVVADVFKKHPEYVEFALRETSDSFDNSRVRQWYDFQLNHENRPKRDDMIFKKSFEAALNEATQYHIPTNNNSEFYSMFESYFRPKFKDNEIVVEPNADYNTFLSAVCRNGNLSVLIDEERQQKWRDYLEKGYKKWAKDSLYIGDKERDLYIIGNFIDHYEGNKSFKIKVKDASNVSLADVREYIIKYLTNIPYVMDFDKAKRKYSYTFGDGYFSKDDTFTINELISILEKNKNFRKLRETFPKTE